MDMDITRLPQTRPDRETPRPDPRARRRSKKAGARHPAVPAATEEPAPAEPPAPETPVRHIDVTA
jgi:hypothetical protein